MKNPEIKRILSIALCALVMVSLAACKKDLPEDTTRATTLPVETVPADTDPRDTSAPTADPTETAGTAEATESLPMDVVEIENEAGETTTVYLLADGRYLDRADQFFQYDGNGTWVGTDGSKWTRKAAE